MLYYLWNTILFGYKMSKLDIKLSFGVVIIIIFFNVNINLIKLHQICFFCFNVAKIKFDFLHKIEWEQENRWNVWYYQNRFNINSKKEEDIKFLSVIKWRRLLNCFNCILWSLGDITIVCLEGILRFR